MSQSPFAFRLRQPRAWLLATAWLIAVGPLQAGEILRDDFSDPNSGWPNMAATRSQDLGFAVYQHGGGYQLTPVQDNVFGFIAAPRQAKGGNVQIDANLFLYAGVGAGAGGVACRYQDPRNFYAFVFRGDGQMLIGRLQDGELTILAQGAHKPNGNLKGFVRFEHVNFAYANGIQVLHDIDFAVEQGQTVALLGSTGSGKTSLVGLLPRFYEYGNGRITIDGIELNEIPREYLRKQIGIVMQEPFLFSCSIRDNITYGVGREVSDAEVEAAARAADVPDVILTFPEGYETMVGERGVTLSGGQKQRVTLARTLLKDPSILILDDATSAVDTETEASIREALQGLTGARTTFIIAHRIQSVMTADLVLVMDNGRIVQRGTHETLMQEPGIYQDTYNLQARIEEELEAELAATTMNESILSANGHGKPKPMPVGD